MAGNPRRNPVALQDLDLNLETRVADRARALERAWRLSPDLLAIADAQGTPLAVNAAWKDLLGREASDLVGQSFVGFIHPDDLGRQRRGGAGEARSRRRRLRRRVLRRRLMPA